MLRLSAVLVLQFMQQRTHTLISQSPYRMAHTPDDMGAQIPRAAMDWRDKEPNNQWKAKQANRDGKIYVVLAVVGYDKGPRESQHAVIGPERICIAFQTPASRWGRVRCREQQCPPSFSTHHFFPHVRRWRHNLLGAGQLKPPNFLQCNKLLTKMCLFSSAEGGDAMKWPYLNRIHGVILCACFRTILNLCYFA